eukprot:scaffold613_cov89-Skeletonema_marinoi.AAC.1
MDLCSLIEASWGRVPSDLLYLHSGSQQLTPGGQNLQQATATGPSSWSLCSTHRLLQMIMLTVIGVAHVHSSSTSDNGIRKYAP